MAVGGRGLWLTVSARVTHPRPLPDREGAVDLECPWELALRRAEVTGTSRT